MKAARILLAAGAQWKRKNADHMWTFAGTDESWSENSIF